MLYLYRFNKNLKGGENMKKLILSLLVVFLLTIGTTSVFADPGGGTRPYESEAIVQPNDDPGGGTRPGDE